MNQFTAVASEPMAMQPAIARQNARGVWLYNPLLTTATQISSKEATERAAHSTARNAVLVPTKSCSDFLYVAERSMYILRALTGQSRDAWLLVGGGNAESVMNWSLNGVESILGT